MKGEDVRKIGSSFERGRVKLVLSTCMSLKERNISSQTIQGLRKWTICELWKKKQCRETGSAKGLFYCDWLFLCKATDDSGHLKRSCSSLMGQLWTCCLLFSRLGISKSQSRGPRTNTGAPFAYARGNVKRLAQMEKKEEEQKNGNFQWTFSRKVN